MIEYLKEAGTQIAVNLVSAFLILFIGLRLVNFAEKRIIRNRNWIKMDETLKNFLFSVVNVSLKALVVISAIMVAGVPESTFVAVLGAAGLAVGLALQGSLSNLAAVVLIITLRPFKVGDFIDGAGHSGTVTDIGLFYTRLTTIDNRAIIIPNSSLAGSSLINYGFYPTRRLDLEFSVDYKSDMTKVKELITSIIEAHPLAMKDPLPFVRLSRHADSGLIFKVRVWANTDDYWELNWDLQEQVKIAFDNNGIEIPYPHMVVQKKEN